MMGDFSYSSFVEYDLSGNNVASGNTDGTLVDSDNDDQFETSDTVTLPTGNSGTWEGTIEIGGTTYPVFFDGVFNSLTLFAQSDNELPGFINTATINIGNSFPFCFGAGTLIKTVTGDRAVESLQIGDLVVSELGQSVPVRWIGRQTVFSAFSGPHVQPVRIRAGALGDELPYSDLTVTADHGLVFDGAVINASALVNGTSIDFVPMSELPERVTYYHVETENHDVILANGAPAETFVDAMTRANFDNYHEYIDLYGAERIIPEMVRPRISSQRLLPNEVKALLGISDEKLHREKRLRARFSEPSA